MTEIEERNKTLVLNAFDTLFNKRDYAAAQHFWSPDYIQQSARLVYLAPLGGPTYDSRPHT